MEPLLFEPGVDWFDSFSVFEEASWMAADESVGEGVVVAVVSRADELFVNAGQVIRRPKTAKALPKLCHFVLELFVESFRLFFLFLSRVVVHHPVSQWLLFSENTSFVS